MANKYIVTLTPQERRELSALITKGKAAARKLMRARILLQADAADDGPGSTDEQIIAAVRSSRATIHRVRQAFVEEGLEAAINAKKPASLYEAFEPAEARRLLEKLEIHHTPKHGSWQLGGTEWGCARRAGDGDAGAGDDVIDAEYEVKE